jgi:hypothetical protein
MKRIALVAALLAASMFVLAGVATAGKVGQAKTWVYDETPGDANTASATWTKDGLKLVKIAPSAEIPLAAGVEFKGLEGQQLTQLSFDMKTGDDCGGGAPRFNVYTATDTFLLRMHLRHAHGSSQRLDACRVHRRRDRRQRRLGKHYLRRRGHPG